MTIVYIIIFLGLSWWLYTFTRKDIVEVRLPFNKSSLIDVTGLEGLVIAMFATCWIGLSPVLSLRLGFLELLCLIGIYKCKNYLPFSFPLKMYVVFLLWLVIGLFYTPSTEFGVRMILKYIYPFLFALLCAKVVRNERVFEYAGSWLRIVGTIAIIFWLTGFAGFILAGIFWLNAAVCTALITVVIFSFALAFHSNQKKKNLIWGILLCLPSIILVYRTDIFGTGVALAMFFILKYKIKGIPIAAVIAFLGLCALFMIPSVKQKMFFNPDKVTMMDYVTGNYDESNVNTSGRKLSWDDVENWFYKGHELTGSGTGRVQKYFYTEAIGWRRGGQLHNDLLVLKCDNGDIGLALFIIAYLLVYLHCMKIYRDSDNPYAQVSALVAGASMLGVFVTMYSDNTLSYSMVTLGSAWGFYGIALGLDYKTKNYAE